MMIVFLWLGDVLLISSCLALFEIWLEKADGWASNLNPRLLGRKLFSGTIIIQIFEAPYLTLYHVLMFGAVVPLFLTAEYLIAGSMRKVCPIDSDAVNQSRWFATINGHRFIPLLFFISIWMAIVTVEDFLWFVWNWHYPNSIEDLVSGKVWWHTQWITLGPIKIPRFYISTMVAAGLLLAASIGLPA